MQTIFTRKTIIFLSWLLASSACVSCISLAAPTPGQAPVAEREIRFDEFYAVSRPPNPSAVSKESAKESAKDSSNGSGGPEFSPSLRALAGKRVRITGYVAPPFRAEAEFLILTSTSAHICPYCNADGNNWPIDLVVVYPRDTPPTTKNTAPVTISGTLEIGPKLDSIMGMVSQLRLIDAVVEIAKR